MIPAIQASCDLWVRARPDGDLRVAKISPLWPPDGLAKGGAGWETAMKRRTSKCPRREFRARAGDRGSRNRLCRYSVFQPSGPPCEFSTSLAEKTNKLLISIFYTLADDAVTSEPVSLFRGSSPAHPVKN